MQRKTSCRYIFNGSSHFFKLFQKCNSIPFREKLFTWFRKVFVFSSSKIQLFPKECSWKTVRVEPHRLVSGIAAVKFHQWIPFYRTQNSAFFRFLRVHLSMIFQIHLVLVLGFIRDGWRKTNEKVKYDSKYWYFIMWGGSREIRDCVNRTQ